MWDSDDDRVFRVNLPGTTISGTAFTEDNRVVVALSRGNMEIFLLTKDLTRIAQTVVKSWAIDVSPSFSADGRKMAFVSDRHGNPNVYVKDMETNEVERVTYEGKYNTSPSLSAEGKLVAFSRLTPGGHRIFVHNLETGRERQVTFGPGNDEEPAFSPDGYFIVFASNRTGEYKLYLTTIHGAEPKMIGIGSGEITHPAFGPLREQ
jgi:TolB protein